MPIILAISRSDFTTRAGKPSLEQRRKNNSLLAANSPIANVTEIAIAGIIDLYVNIPATNSSVKNKTKTVRNILALDLA